VPLPAGAVFALIGFLVRIPNVSPHAFWIAIIAYVVLAVSATRVQGEPATQGAIVFEFSLENWVRSTRNLTGY